jgi:hypothetical protein
MSRYPGTVYLLHFAEPIGNPERPNRAGTAQHYIGWAQRGRLLARVAEQLAGGSAAASIMRHLHSVGISAELARVWEGSRDEERRIKNMGGASRSCPLCGIRPAARRVRQVGGQRSTRPPFWPALGSASSPRASAALALEPPY